MPTPAKPLLLPLARRALPTLLGALAACGGGSGGPPSATSITLPPASGSQAPALTLTLTPTAIKTFRFTWADVAGETEYRLLEDPDGTSGYTRVATLPADTTQHDREVFLPERVNARYILQACQASVCTDSAVVNASGSLVNAIGYVKASQPADDAQFGHSLALSADGQTLAVGAPGNGALNGNSGAVYVYTRDGITWRQQARLEAPSPQLGDYFGYSVALSTNGDTLAIGAPHDSGVASVSGAAFVFTRNGGVWGLPKILRGLNTGVGDLFGISVALSGDGNTLAVGAENESGSATGINGPDDDNRAQSGAAYVFVRNGNAWSQQAYAKASNTQAFAFFGRRLALSTDGRTLAVGAPGESSVVTFSGAVYVFVHDGTTWGEQGYVKASNADAFTRYGEAVALSADGGVLAVGSAVESSSATGIGGDENNFAASASGAAYVYARHGVTWSQQAYVKASNTQDDDLFGTSVALSADGRTLAVGAIGEDSDARGIAGDQGNNAADNSGAAYVFQHTVAGWRQQAYVKPSNTVNQQVRRFGRAVTLSGDGKAMAVGSPFANNASAGVGGDQNDTSGWNVGAVYLY
jgi:hypothetical protein